MIVVGKVAFVVLLSVYCSNITADPDVAEGREIAMEWCAECHDVMPAGPFKQHPPSFASIAVFRSEEQIFGRIVFPPLHSSMPQVGYMLTPDNLEKLVAYIMSLEDDLE